MERRNGKKAVLCRKSGLETKELTTNADERLNAIKPYARIEFDSEAEVGRKERT